MLKFAGFESVATGAGVILMPEYEAVVEAFDKKHSVLVGCLDLPKETPIKALLGRDILDNFEICLNGKKREMVVKERNKQKVYETKFGKRMLNLWKQ